VRPDTHTHTPEDAAAYEALRGRDEWIGGGVGDEEPNPLLDAPDARERPDPWLPYTCPRCGDEDRTGMPEVCPCGWRNYGIE
jgi:hypothetical protein